MQAQGVKVGLVPYREIALQAEQYAELGCHGGRGAPRDKRRVSRIRSECEHTPA